MDSLLFCAPIAVLYLHAFLRMKRIAVLGSTGSIGRQTLDVVRWHPDGFRSWGWPPVGPSDSSSEQVAEFAAAACAA